METQKGKQRATRSGDAKPEIKTEPDLIRRPLGSPTIDHLKGTAEDPIKVEIPEPIYPEERDDNGHVARRVNIEDINNAISDEDEDEDVTFVSSSRRKGKSLAIRSSGGMMPVRLERKEHKERVTVVNTEPAAAPTIDLEDEAGELDLFVPNDHEAELRHKRRLENTRDGKHWPGVWQDDDDEIPVKPDPDSESVSQKIDRKQEKKPFKEPLEPHKAKAKAKLRHKTTRKPQQSIPQTEEDKAELMRDLVDRQVLAEELGSLQSTLAAEGQHNDHVHDKEGRLYLFQFPPILPPLYNPVKKEEEEGVDDDIEMTGALPAPGASGATGSSAIDLTKPDSEAVVIKTEAADGPPIFTVPPELVSEQGYMGKLIVRESGKVELNWGGTSLALGRGSDFDFLTTTVMVDGNSGETVAVGDGGNDAAGMAGRGIGMGKVMGKFVATPDWSKIL